MNTVLGYTTADIISFDGDIAWLQGELRQKGLELNYANAARAALRAQRDALRNELRRISPNHPLLPKLRQVFCDAARQHARTTGMNPKQVEKWLAETPHDPTGTDPQNHLDLHAPELSSKPDPHSEAERRITALERELTRSEARARLADAVTAIERARSAGLAAQGRVLRAALRQAAPDHQVLDPLRQKATFTAAARAHGERTGISPERLDKWLEHDPSEPESPPELPFPGGLF